MDITRRCPCFDPDAKAASRHRLLGAEGGRGAWVAVGRVRRPGDARPAPSCWTKVTSARRWARSRAKGGRRCRRAHCWRGEVVGSCTSAAWAAGVRSTTTSSCSSWSPTGEAGQPDPAPESTAWGRLALQRSRCSTAAARLGVELAARYVRSRRRAWAAMVRRVHAALGWLAWSSATFGHGCSAVMGGSQRLRAYARLRDPARADPFSTARSSTSSVPATWRRCSTR